MAKRKLLRLPYCDVPGACKWEKYSAETVAQVLQHLDGLVFKDPAGLDTYKAWNVAADVLGEESLTEEGARRLLRALAVTDGGPIDATDHVLKAMAVLLCRLEPKRRAIMYYVCCDRLGYDPAESDVQPERL